MEAQLKCRKGAWNGNCLGVAIKIWSGELLPKVGPGEICLHKSSALLIHANPCGTWHHFCPVSSIELIEDSIGLTKGGCWPHLLDIRLFPFDTLPTCPSLPGKPLPNLDLSFSKVFSIQIKNDVHQFKGLGLLHILLAWIQNLFTWCFWSNWRRTSPLSCIQRSSRCLVSSYCSSKGWESHGKPVEISTKITTFDWLQPNSEANGRHDWFPKEKEVILTCLLAEDQCKQIWQGQSGPAMSSVQPSFSSFFSRHFQDFDLLHPPCRDAQVKQTASKSLKPVPYPSAPSLLLSLIFLNGRNSRLKYCPPPSWPMTRFLMLRWC